MAQSNQKRVSAWHSEFSGQENREQKTPVPHGSSAAGTGVFIVFILRRTLFSQGFFTPIHTPIWYGIAWIYM
jgi:hypothetical protein